VAVVIHTRVLLQLFEFMCHTRLTNHRHCDIATVTATRVCSRECLLTYAPDHLRVLSCVLEYPQQSVARFNRSLIESLQHTRVCCPVHLTSRSPRLITATITTARVYLLIHVSEHHYCHHSTRVPAVVRTQSGIVTGARTRLLLYASEHHYCHNNTHASAAIRV